MRNGLFTIGIALQAFLLACHRPVETRHGTSLQTVASLELSAIDSLMWRQPDGALAQIVDYFACRDVSRNVSGNANDSLGGVS